MIGVQFFGALALRWFFPKFWALGLAFHRSRIESGAAGGIIRMESKRRSARNAEPGRCDTYSFILR
jgi:hypothetical protein